MVMLISTVTYMENNEELFDQGRPLPKFGEWDVNDPASADGFTVIFNKARDEKKTGGKPESLEKADTHEKMALLRSSPAGGILMNSCLYKSFHCMLKPPAYILNKIGMNGGAFDKALLGLDFIFGCKNLYCGEIKGSKEDKHLLYLYLYVMIW
ncbi:hypothetical protein CXB51_029839 [Gossypium anomalum]|uniref:RIN4 pathogenic type III effector avirulence factor Avr cleavage site domain-containing protein n=1 Tax=Gossypium anomalum TaxID=47600 RepID=A0A8J5Z023_9ROSI|nr:hypothetical protein CXB51_029839 [Gossypium anomalum]